MEIAPEEQGAPERLAVPASPATVGEFRFLGYDWKADTTTVYFRYRLSTADGPLGEAVHEFTEHIDFASAVVEEGLGQGSPAPESGSALDRTLVLAGALLGISYYKAALPPVYAIDPPGVTAEARAFIAEAITQGLGELSFRAGLPGLPRPEIRYAHPVADPLAPAPLSDEQLARPLVAIGGGKDSSVSLRVLERGGFDLVQVAVNPNAVIRRVMAAAQLPEVGIRRRIDPALLALNGEGAINGHVPVTAMNSALLVAQTLILGTGPVVMSNERSSSEPTLVWNGEAVNHQWSKSLEAERMLAAAFTAQTGTPSLWFSLLRPLSELRIAKVFAGSERFDDTFVSCNRAFRLDGAITGWCGDCDKCRFVFLIFSPFMSRDRLTGIFGKNLFEDAAQLPGYEALLGFTEQKPWECVGEIGESRVAAGLATGLADWSDTVFARWLGDTHPEAGGWILGAPRALALERPEPPQDVPEVYAEVLRAYA